jgi:putative hemolysin
MKLVDRKDIAKITKLDKIGMPYLAELLMQITKLSKVNDFYHRNFNAQGINFVDALFSEIELEYDYYQEELSRIPKEGAFVTISNHPLGGIDGLMLLKLITQIRPDYKVMANFLLKKIEPISDYFLSVNPFENHKDAHSNMQGIKDAMSYIKAGHGLGTFPAGEVSSLDLEDGKIKDREWQLPAIKLLRKMQAPIVPVYFKARNSRLFYMLSLLSPTLQTAKLPSEIFQQRNKSVTVRIGKPILPSEYKDLSDEETSDLLRERTYRLSNTLDSDSRFKRMQQKFSIKPKRQEKPIAEAQPQDKIEHEVEKALENGRLMTEFRNFQIFCSPAQEIPSILMEIGRLREIAFREVGEGTGDSLDLDKFDQTYLHLFLWDKDSNKIAGAYRLGMGADLYAKNGIEGFYVRTLFKIDEPAHHMFKQGLEMGRAFITKEYQQKPMPLFLLWKGITHVILRNPEKVRYLLGGVSISNQFSRYSKSIMIEFVKRHFYDAEMANAIHPRKEYKVKLGPLEKAMLDKTTPDDINKFDRYIEDIEPGNMRFPVLLKKYIKQNAKIVAFNVDPKFNNAVDGLMYIDINDLPEQTIKPVLEELENATKENSVER